eukprot:Skav202828  [mRNA]  locus=scaffold3852:313242:313649:- [translate_table: standard]
MIHQIHGISLPICHLAQTQPNRNRCPEREREEQVQCWSALVHHPCNFTFQVSFRVSGGKVRAVLQRLGTATSRGETPLHRAAYWGKAEVAQLLLAANAALDLKNDSGTGPRREDGRVGPFGQGKSWNELEPSLTV